jgi:hypothetical protein
MTIIPTQDALVLKSTCPRTPGELLQNAFISRKKQRRNSSRLCFLFVMFSLCETSVHTDEAEELVSGLLLALETSEHAAGDRCR